MCGGEKSRCWYGIDPSVHEFSENEISRAIAKRTRGNAGEWEEYMKDSSLNVVVRRVSSRTFG